MGVDFLNRTKPTIRKLIDAHRVALGTPGLFTVRPGSRPRSSVATIVAGCSVAGGEALIVEARNGSVKLRRGNDIVGSLDSPSGDIISEIEHSGGAANGVVQRVHRVSGKADVTLC